MASGIESNDANVARGADSDRLESVPEVAASRVLSVQREESARYHQVQPGDTLTAIAQKNQIALNRLIEENGLSTTTVLQPGQLLYIPSAAP